MTKQKKLGWLLLSPGLLVLIAGLVTALVVDAPGFLSVVLIMGVLVAFIRGIGMVITE